MSIMAEKAKAAASRSQNRFKRRYSRNKDSYSKNG